MKAKAAEIAAPLATSTLQHADKHTMRYLTCIEVGDADVPWTKEDDEVMED